MLTYYRPLGYPWFRPWDYGITWRSNRTVAPTISPLSLSYVTEKVLNVQNDGYDQQFVQQCIDAAARSAEEATSRALAPQTWELIIDGFPAGEIVLPRLPVLEIESFGYVDENGDAQTIAGSPADYQFIPSGAYKRARVRALSGASWPSTQGIADAVTITYRAGYETQAEMPPEIVTGMCLMIAELYKQRSLSVQGTSVTPSVLKLSDFWKMVY